MSEEEPMLFDESDLPPVPIIEEEEDVESLTPWPEMGEAMRVYGPDGSSPSLKQHAPNVLLPKNETICVQGSVVGRQDHNGPGGMGWKSEESYTLNTMDAHAVTDTSIDDEVTVDLGRTSDRIRINADTAATLQAGGGGSGAKTGLYLQPIPLQDTRELDKKQNGLGVGQEGDEAYTLDTASRQGVAVAFDEMNFTVGEQHHVLRAGTKQSTGVVEPITAHESGHGWWSESDQAGTLRAEGENRPSRPSNIIAEPVVFTQNQREEVRMLGDTTGALASSSGSHQTNYVAEPYGFSAGNSANAHSIGAEQGVSPPVRAASSGTNQAPTVGTSGYGVRRLTPLECERLQAFPDGWTDVPGMSDSARYKAMGNAVTVNTVRWVLGMMLAADQDMA